MDRSDGHIRKANPPWRRVIGASACLILLWLFPSSQVGLGQDDSLARHLRYLASDELRGRGNNQPELALAADYIARHFQQYGLEPVGDDGTCYQSFELTTGLQLSEDDAVVVLALPSSINPLELGTDFIPLSYGSEQSVLGPVVFAGFGITAPEYDYDDYREIDVRDKIVVIFEHEPQEQSERSLFAGTELTTHSTVLSKVLSAKHRGAAAVILIPDTVNHYDPDPSLERYSGQPMEDLGIHAIQLSRVWGERLLESSGRSFVEMRRWLNGHLTPYSFDIPGVQAGLSLNVHQVRTRVANVLGMVSGQSDEYVVIGAHYDHLGLGGKSSLAPNKLGEIHNGADDNASGTAGLLELARYFSTLHPRRNLVFIAFAGEELGLRGSSFYTQNPVVPLEKTVAMLNLDMIGRSRGDLLIAGVGTARQFRGILEELQPYVPLNLNFAETPTGPSDHRSFTARKIPVLFFFSGLHPDYHKPSDDWEKINLETTGQIVELVRMIIEELDRLEELEFVDLDITAYDGDNRWDRGSVYGPLFGSIPDMSYESGGVRLSHIRAGSPAQRAGVKAGDVLVEFAGKSIDILHDFTFVLRRQKPGDEVPVVVLREGKRLEFRVVLEER